MLLVEAKTGIAILDPQSHVGKDEKLDTAARSPAGPNVGPGLPAGHGSAGGGQPPAVKERGIFMSRVSETPADVANRSVTGRIDEGPWRHENAGPQAERSITGLLHRPVTKRPQARS